MRAIWDEAGRLGVERFGFPPGAIRQAALVATAVCWVLALVLWIVGA